MFFFSMQRLIASAVSPTFSTVPWINGYTHDQSILTSPHQQCWTAFCRMAGLCWIGVSAGMSGSMLWCSPWMLPWVQKRMPCERLASSDHCGLDHQQLAATRKYNTKILECLFVFWEFGSFDTLHPRRLLRLLRLEPLRTLSGWHCDTSQTNSVPMTFFLRCLFLILCLAHEVASRWKVEGDLESHLAKWFH